MIDQILEKYPSNVKVVVKQNMDALYFSREPIPSMWKGEALVPMFMQIGAIAFRRNVLTEFEQMEETLLEINIFGIKKNLYKKKLRVYFVKFIRKDKKFRSSIELIRQMNKDVISAKKGLKGK